LGSSVCESAGFDDPNIFFQFHVSSDPELNNLSHIPPPLDDLDLFLFLDFIRRRVDIDFAIIYIIQNI